MIGRIDSSINLRELIVALSLKVKAPHSVFEERIKRFFDVPHCLAVSSGRAGIHAILKANNISGSEIILPAYTCTAVAEAIVASGNFPKFIDISLDDYNADLDLIAGALCNKTKS